MNISSFAKRIFKQYPWPRTKRSFLAVGLCMVLSAPGWMALRQTDKRLSVLLEKGRQEGEAAVFFANVLNEHKGLKETYGRRKTGDISLDESLRELHALAKRERISLGSIKPAQADEKNNREGLRRRKIEMAFQAPEDGVYRFLGGFSELAFFSSPDSVAISASPEGAPLVDVRMTLEIFDDLRISQKKARDYLKKAICSDKAFAEPRAYVTAAGRKIFGSAKTKPRRAILAQEKKEDVLAQLMLVGIMEDDGQGRRAAVEDKRTSRTFYLCVNDAVGDLVVSEIGDHQVVFSGGGQCYTLTL
ncbi:MAG: hypothetical protein PHH75_06115 [Candidatus Omnitrophica bacterium]|nr:hypothetical protein [Candidatus Omnitrophota bacterium]MDD5574737.1 hypothetical protein [Candidatus Omnitrophota bacterium]